ncbi:hypothetical protein [Luteimonas sp. YGD11-2]|uniref:hypothetical protein n=1 Tax=Luteimonas sp. YGD11-2 TaxID=2508168 RepID=UPI00100B0F85|nr:hypothetical protein [Luteimonas sp. YGD11-2]
MALSPEELKALAIELAAAMPPISTPDRRESGQDMDSAPRETVGAFLQILEALDSGKATADQLRRRAMNLPGGGGLCALPWIDLADDIHRSASPVGESRMEEPVFRRGTGMAPVAWADCLWQPAIAAGGDAPSRHAGGK